MQAFLLQDKFQNLEYPTRPNQNAAGARKRNMFNYRNLIVDGVIKYIPGNEFKKVHEIVFNAAEGDMYSYHGQVDARNKKPNGIGMAVMQGKGIYEGYFEKGMVSMPHLYTLPDGDAVARFTTNDGREYQINWEGGRFFVARRRKKNGYEEKKFQFQKDFLKEFDFS